MMAGVALVLVVVGQAGAQIPGIGFEAAEGYATGTLVGQQGWYYGETGVMVGTVIKTTPAVAPGNAWSSPASRAAGSITRSRLSRSARACW
jgi:hypothetical protein